MAFIPTGSRLASLGNALGEGAIEPIKTGLGLLTQQKVQDLAMAHQQRAQQAQYQKNVQGLQALNIPHAEQLAYLPENILRDVVKNSVQGPQQNEYNSVLSQLYGVPQESMQSQISQGGLGGVTSKRGEVEPQQSSEVSKSKLSQPISSSINKVSPKSPEEIDIFRLGKNLNSKNFDKLLNHYNQLSTRAQTERLTRDKMRQDVAKFNKNLEFKQQQEVMKDVRHREKLGREDQKSADKETKDLYTALTSESKAAKNGDMRLDRMEQLVKSGKLPTGNFFRLTSDLKHIGGISGAVGSILSSFSAGTPEAEEFEKLSSDFIKDAKSYFGNRLTDADLNAFLKTVPTLSQTDEGKLRIINNMRIFNKAAEIKKKSAEQIIKANGNRRPIDLGQLIEEKSAPQLDRLAEQFTSGYNDRINQEPLISKPPKTTGQKIYDWLGRSPEF